MPSSVHRVVKGDDLLYRFFVDLFEDEGDLATKLPGRMLAGMGIWLPLETYRTLPVLLPWVVRDHTCRGNKKKGIPDQWGAPNADGFLRDDNSLIKGLPKSLSVNRNAQTHLRGARMGSEFVASHVWRVVDHNDLASRVPLLNSFVPNLVWLPAQVAKLTDREGSPVQKALQALAWKTYRHAPVDDHLSDVVEEAWSLIPEPDADIDTEVENWFDPTERFYTTRRSRLSDVIAALRSLEAGESLTHKVTTTRYGEGLPHVSESARRELLGFLERFALA